MPVMLLKAGPSYQDAAAAPRRPVGLVGMGIGGLAKFLLMVRLGLPKPTAE